MRFRDAIEIAGEKVSEATTRVIASLISVFSPRKALIYQYTRQAYRTWSKRGYAAGKKGGPNQLWNPSNKTADLEMGPDRAVTTARARDLVRNNAYVAGAIKTIVANVIGTGITPKANVKKKSGTPDKAFNEGIRAAWAAWAEAAGFAEIQKLILRHLITDGEILCMPITGRFESDNVPLKLKLYESDHLAEALSTVALKAGSNSVYAGIEANGDGEPVAYHLYNSHPSGYSYFSQSDIKRITADSIIHVFAKERVTQSRGFSWLAPVIMEIYDLAEYKDYEMIGAKLAAAFSVFVKSPYADPTDDSLTNGQYAKDGTTRLQYIEPGRIERLLPGEDISVASHDRPGSNYAPFVQMVLHGISIALGLAYESFSGDYTSSTFSSARSALLGERRNYRIIQKFLIDNFLAPVWKEFVKYAVLSGKVQSAGFMSDPSRFYSVVWQAPGWEWIDPEKDAKAAELELSLGLTTRRKLCAARGEDFEDNFEQLAIEEKLAEDLKLDVLPVKKAEALPGTSSGGSQDGGSGGKGNSGRDAQILEIA